MRDKDFFNKIQEVIDCLDELDDMIDTQPQELQKVDYELSDWYHLIENTPLEKITPAAAVMILTRIKILRLQRRSLQREHILEKTYKDNASKMMGNNTRPFLLTELNKTLKNFDNEYKNRILTDDDINKVLSKESSKKRGRPKKQKDNIEKKVE